VRFKYPNFLPFFLLLLMALVSLPACGPKTPAETAGDPPSPKTLVKTTRVAIHDIRKEARFPATTFYPESNRLASPISGHILLSPQEAGETVRKGQILFTIETREHRAINADPELKKSDLAQMGVIKVYAPAAGIILSLDQRLGDFVSEGTTLCNIARNEKIGFRLSVPFEFNAYVKTGTDCVVELPDSTRLPARVAENLSTVSVTSQTLSFLVKPIKTVSVPEGLNVVVVVQTNESKQATLLPKSAILTNEMMDEFWVMKMINDSTAIKLPVTLGMTLPDSVQISHPSFSEADRILVEGNYGLEDTALVKISNLPE
jgi:biotin carboxyl carrier protein